MEVEVEVEAAVTMACEGGACGRSVFGPTCGEMGDGWLRLSVVVGVVVTSGMGVWMGGSALCSCCRVDACARDQ